MRHNWARNLFAQASLNHDATASHTATCHLLRSLQLRPMDMMQTAPAVPRTETAPEIVASVVTLDHLSASYREGAAILPVLDDISLSVAQGEILALIGPSGSGKSTLLDIIAGLYGMDSGRVLLRGEILSETARLGQSAYMRQRDLLMPWRTTLDNATLALEIAGVSRREARLQAKQRFPEFGLEGFENAYPAQLSGGMRQRAAFLRTILAGRPLLLLDEPFGALDALTRATMQDFLLDLLSREPRTVILVTHDVEEAVFLSDRVIAISHRPGQIVHEETIKLPRPRRRALVTSDTFVAHKAAILRAIGLISAEDES
jgi:putative hydroxymethylpyrimidine transport system ATP-binding protein